MATQNNTRAKRLSSKIGSKHVCKHSNWRSLCFSCALNLGVIADIRESLRGQVRVQKHSPRARGKR
jgi:hypothetical protein